MNLPAIMLLAVNLVTQRVPVDSIPVRKVAIQTKINMLDLSVNSGFINKITDSSITIAPRHSMVFSNVPAELLRKINAEDISSIGIRKKGAVGRGILIGSLAGALIGTVIGYASYRKPDCPPGSFLCFDLGPGIEGAAGGSIGLTLGAVAGTIIGLGSRKKFSINGKRDKMQDVRMHVMDRIYK